MIGLKIFFFHFLSRKLLGVAPARPSCGLLTQSLVVISPPNFDVTTTGILVASITSTSDVKSLPGDATSTIPPFLSSTTTMDEVDLAVGFANTKLLDFFCRMQPPVLQHDTSVMPMQPPVLHARHVSNAHATTSVAASLLHNILVVTRAPGSGKR